MPQFNFGSGLLFAQPTSGAGPAFAFGTLQDVGVDFSSDTKKLYGAYDFPDIALNGHSTCTIKAKYGQLSGALWNQLYFGGTSSPGMRLLVLAEAGAVPTQAPYTVTVQNASGANIQANSATDLSVRYASTGNALQNIGTGTPAAGQYTVSNGVYTFAAADAGAALIFTYHYRSTSATTGTTYARNQQLVGTTPFFGMFFSNSLNGLQSNMQFFRAKCSKLTRATKNDDFMVPEMDFEIFADGAGRVFEEYESSY